MKRWCRKCKRTLAKSRFGVDRSNPDGLMIYCRACVRSNNKRRHDRIKEKYDRLVQSYKMEQGCQECGFNKHPAALHLDHIVPFDRHKNGGYAAFRQWVAARNPTLPEIRRELEKCQVLCANCHAIRTVLEGHNRGRPQASDDPIPSSDLQLFPMDATMPET